MLQGCTGDTFWDCVFATTSKNLDTAEHVSTLGASLSVWASLGRLLGDAHGGQARNRWAAAAQWPLKVLVTYIYVLDSAYSFLDTAALSLKCEHALLSTARNPYLPATLGSWGC